MLFQFNQGQVKYYIDFLLEVGIKFIRARVF